MSDDHLQLIARWYQRLDPDRAFADGGLYVDLDHFDCDGRPLHLRGPAPVTAMLELIRLASVGMPTQSTHLFSGFRGTGKTTELGRLATWLEAYGFTVLRVSARKYHHLTTALSREELAILLAAGIGEAALEVLGEGALGQLAKQGVWEKLSGGLEKLFKESELTFEFGPAKLKPALYRGEGLKIQLEQALRDRPDRTRELLHGLVHDITAAIHPRQIVVLVDDLEKFDVPTTRVVEVYTQMQELFFASADLFELPGCHVVYTVPPYVALLNRSIKEKYAGNLHLLPCVKVRSRPPTHEPYAPGIAALTRLIEQRVDLDALLGPHRDDCMRRLVIASGGNLRDLLSLVRDCVRPALDAGLPVGPDIVEQAIQLHAAHFRLTREPFELIRDIRVRGDLLDVDEARQRGFADALDQRLLLCYWNGDFWYDAHPMIEAQLDAVAPRRGEHA